VSTRKWLWKVVGFGFVAGALVVSAPSASTAVVLYAVSGDGATPPSSLFTLDLATAAPNAVGALGNGDDGEGIAFRPDDGLLYRTSGGTDGLEFFEAVNPDNAETGPNLVPADTYGPAPVGEIFGIGWYPPLGVFLACDLNFDFYHVAPDGRFMLVGNSGIAMRGFAVVGAQVFGVSSSSQELYEVDPSDGAVLDVFPLTVDGAGTTGNGLATHPDTGLVYAIVKNPANPSGGRLLATLDVTTGQATSIDDTGLKLAGITFRTHAPLYAISGDGASPASTLYRLDLGNGAATLLTSVGNGDDGEGSPSDPTIAFSITPRASPMASSSSRRSRSEAGRSDPTSYRETPMARIPRRRSSRSAGIRPSESSWLSTSTTTSFT
jgi:hypothetical protein